MSDAIAIVDDDESLRLALASLFRSAGFHVLVFASAAELLAASDLPAIRCLILDLRMPGMDGLELQRHLADGGHRIPTIILSAHGSGELRSRALRGGAIAFLPKPFDAEALLHAVEVVLKSSRRPA